MFSDIDLVREVGLRKFSAFTNHQPPPASVFKTAPKSVKTISQFGLFGSKDTYWKGLRSTFNNIFHQVSLRERAIPSPRRTQCHSRTHHSTHSTHARLTHSSKTS